MDTDAVEHTKKMAEGTRKRIEKRRQVIAEQTSQKRARCLAEFHQVCFELGFDPFVVAGKRRTQNVVRQRDQVIVKLRKRGHGYLSIGYVVNRDHSSCVDAVKRYEG